MQQLPVFQDEHTIGPFLRRLIAGLSSLVLALAQNMFVYWGVSSFQFSLPMLMLIIALLYVVAPIPLSAFVAYQTRQSYAGREASNGIGCIGALLATPFFVGIYIFIGISSSYTYKNFFREDFTFFNLNGFFLGFGLFLGFISAFFSLFALFGAYLGSMVGARLGKRREGAQMRHS